ncbi:hypothetical protein BG011_005772 [Mortierella polycephala]|uniref:Uncharacterized protein n=1 Tax=Mortierella polycephala TaxID=41804 RepID=A0A9P6PXX9_9FUNG|nr:hypothetical protein BG011_005772 [Mortierella polycephala]
MAHSGALKKRVLPPVPVSPQVKEITTPNAVAAAAPTPQLPTSKTKPAATTKPTATTKPPAPAPVPTKSTIITTTTVAITSTITTTTETSISTSTLPTPLATDGSQQDTGPITTEPTSKSAANPGLIAGIVGGVVVLVVLIAGLLFRVKRKRGREVREAELYQQQSMMNKYSEGSSAVGYGDGSRLSLQQQQVYHISHRQQSQQPEWFAKKSALEYYSQVPPMDELRRQKMEQHEQKEQQQQQYERWQLQRPGPFSQGSNNMTYTSSSSNPFTQHGVPIAAGSLSGSNSSAEKTPKGESIPLTPTVHSDHPLTSPRLLADLQSAAPYKQHQYQQPRISTHGFYDFLLEDDDLLGTPTTTTAATTTKLAVSPQARSPYHPLSDPLSPKSPVSPPPIPRSTRPISVASASSFKLVTTEIMLDPSAPAVPALPRST